TNIYIPIIGFTAVQLNYSRIFRSISLSLLSYPYHFSVPITNTAKQKPLTPIITDSAANHTNALGSVLLFYFFTFFFLLCTSPKTTPAAPLPAPLAAYEGSFAGASGLDLALAASRGAASLHTPYVSQCHNPGKDHSIRLGKVGHALLSP